MRTYRLTSALMAFLAICALSVTSGTVSALAGNVRKSDGTLKIFVEYKLAKDGILIDNNVKVGVASGTITLDGTVPTLYDRTKASAEAHDVCDSYRVINNLSVTAPRVADRPLAAAVAKRVENHVFYTVFDWLRVDAKNGVVTLRGWVDNPWDVNQYESEASRVPGVTGIVNRLRTERSVGSLRYRVARLIYDDPFYWQYGMELNPPIHVIVNNDNVILKGYVNSPSESGYLASQVRFRTDAMDVVNNLHVSPD